MPFKRKASSSFGSNSQPYKKTKYTVATKVPTSLSNTNSLLRPKQQCVLRYHEDITLDAGVAGIPGIWSFSALSLRDPNFTGVGHQPRGFDQLMQLYSHYFVDEVCIEVWFNSTGSNSQLGFIQLRDSSVSSMTRDDALEYTTMTEKVVSANAGYPTKITYTCKPNQFLGLPKHDASMKGGVSSSETPDADAYLTVGVMPLSAGTDSTAIAAVVKLTYKCTLVEPTEPTSS